MHPFEAYIRQINNKNITFYIIYNLCLCVAVVEELILLTNEAKAQIINPVLKVTLYRKYSFSRTDLFSCLTMYAVSIALTPMCHSLFNDVGSRLMNSLC